MSTPRLPGFLKKQLQRAAIQAAGDASSPTILNRALLVGANLQKISKLGAPPTFDVTGRIPFLSHRDAGYVGDVAAVLPAYGFALTADTVFQVANLNIDPDHDFLRAVYEADFVMFCHLYHNNLDAVEDQRENYPGQKIVKHYTRDGLNPARTQSIFAAQDYLWQIKLDETGAQVAVNVSMSNGGYVGGMDFPTSIIARPPFRFAAQTSNLSTFTQYDILVREPAVAVQRALVPA